MPAKPNNEARRLAYQLVSLDVSTVIEKLTPTDDGITRRDPPGVKAPSMPRMVQDLADNYRRFSGAGASAHFSQVRDTAVQTREQRTQPQHGLLDRVVRNSGELHDILDSTGGTVTADGSVELDESKLTPAQAATIRKAWELALDPINLATNVSLEGDVVTRFSSRGGAPPPDAVVAFHGQMVAASLAHWAALIGVLTQFLGTLARLLPG